MCSALAKHWVKWIPARSYSLCLVPTLFPVQCCRCLFKKKKKKESRREHCLPPLHLSSQVLDSVSYSVTYALQGLLISKLPLYSFTSYLSVDSNWERRGIERGRVIETPAALFHDSEAPCIHSCRWDLHAWTWVFAPGSMSTMSTSLLSATAQLPYLQFIWQVPKEFETWNQLQSLWSCLMQCRSSVPDALLAGASGSSQPMLSFTLAYAAPGDSSWDSLE